MFFEDDDNTQDVSDTAEGIAGGVAHGAEEAGHAIKRDAEQTKDDVEDAVRGEDGNNS